MSPQLERAIYQAWNHADLCTQILLSCGANGEREMRAPDVAAVRRLRESADYLQMYAGDIERLAASGGPS